MPAIQDNFPNIGCKVASSTFAKLCFGRKKAKMLMALAFFPVNLVPAGFEILNVETSGQVEALFQSGFQPLKFRFGMFMVWLCGPTTFYKGKTETVVRQMDDGYTRGRGFIKRGAAYGVQQRRVAALTGRLHRSEISIEHFLRAIAYHTPATAGL
ncbi:hypothetical protein T11_10856 [Trichinella zimbabwensis]|uniref:Uncharacterized protein n=1 Tax=Trichinella zimbabwensis TaxID=268475 RepID=A0A0V1HR33_9BILA|nr:hypothetical protein T11_10856 [Trichinella zimbabwensis]